MNNSVNLPHEKRQGTSDKENDGLSTMIPGDVAWFTTNATTQQQQKHPNKHYEFLSLYELYDSMMLVL